MKGKVLKKAVACALALLLVSGNLVMPGSAMIGGRPVTVSATGEQNTVSLSVDSGFDEGVTGHYYCNMPQSGTTSADNPAVLTITAADIAEGKDSFRLYDFGGRNGQYANGYSGYLKVILPENYLFRMSGTVKTESTGYDWLTITDPAAGNVIGKSRYGGNAEDSIVETIYSDSNSVLFVFRSDNSNVSDGIDLAVQAVRSTDLVCCTYSGIDGSYLYTGQEIRPEPVITDRSGTALVKDTDYTLSWDQDCISVGTHSVTAAGIGNYSGTLTMEYDICSTEMFLKTDNSIADDTAGHYYVNFPDTAVAEAGELDLTSQSATGFTFKVYDDGGKNGNYSHQYSNGMKITAASGYVFEITGTVRCYINGNERLIIYDGADNTANVLGRPYYGNSNGQDVGTLVTSGNTVFLDFNTADYDYSGIDLTVRILERSDISLGSGEFSEPMYLSENVPLYPEPTVRDVCGTVLEKDVDYTLVYEDTDNFTDGVHHITVRGIGNMHGELVLDYNVFNRYRTLVEDNASAANEYDRYHVDMPYIGVTAEPDNAAVLDLSGSDVRKFRLYDDGGNNKAYSMNYDGYLKMIAPVGYHFVFTGNMQTYSGAYLNIYDGADASDALIGDTLSGNGTDIGLINGSGTEALLYFHSGSSGAGSGLNLRVTIVGDDEEYPITINQVSNGSVTTESDTAVNGSDVAVTRNPDEGYYMSECSISYDGKSHVIPGSEWYRGTPVSFEMPPFAAALTPVFRSTSDPAGALPVNIPSSGVTEVIVPDTVALFRVYDNNGPSNNYSSSCSGGLKLVAPEGYHFVFNGSVDTYDTNDKLEIFDGTDDTARKLGKDSYSGTINNIDTSVSSGRNAFLKFTSNANNNDIGVDIIVRVVADNAENSITCAEAENGSIAALVSSARPGSQVAVNVDPADGYVLNYCKIESNGITTIIDSSRWYRSADQSGVTSFTFTMPAGDAVLTPVFARPDSVDSSLRIDMDYNSSISISLSDSFRSFRLLDNGGLSYNYGDVSNDDLVLTAPEGCLFRVTGSYSTVSSYDSLGIYQGEDNTGELLGGKKLSGNGTISEPLISSGNKLFIKFTSDGSNTSSGFDLDFIVFDPDNAYSIEKQSSEYGSVSCADSAKPGESVAVTVTPETGYVLDYCEVRSEGSSFVADGSRWYIAGVSREFSFTMPEYDVTLVPVFKKCDELSIDLPRTGTLTAQIPAEVTHFKVYDDGGSNKEYSNGCDGTLLIQGATDTTYYSFSGTFVCENNHDYMTLSELNGTEETALGKDRYTNNEIINETETNSKDVKLFFHSDSSIVAKGIDLDFYVHDISVEHNITVQTADHGSVTPDTISCYARDTVTFEVSQDFGYILDHCDVTYAGKTVVIDGSRWHELNGNSKSANGKYTFSLLMPPYDVTVTPVFTSVNDLSLVIPEKGELNFWFPDELNEIHVYDNGGASGQYTNNCNSVVHFFNSGNKTLGFEGSYSTENSHDRLTFYSGPEINDSALLWGPFSGGGNFTNTSELDEVTFTFVTDSSVLNSGFDMKVSLIGKEDKFAINVSDAQRGRITAASESVSGADVEVTVEADEGWVLDYCTIIYGTESYVIDGSRWYQTGGGSFTFKMPMHDVTLLPVFTNKSDSLYITLPKTGVHTAVIPEGVGYFRVYDDGGNQRSYSNSCDCTMLLTAPDGYHLNFSGTVETYNENDILSLFDGTSVTSPTLGYSPYSYNNYINSLSASGENVLLRFYSDSEETGNGFYLYVKPVSDTEEFTLTRTDVQNGSISFEGTEFRDNQEVTVSIAPEDGYSLNHCVLQYNNRRYLIDSSAWFNDYGKTSFTFRMPAGNALITPVFVKTGEFYIDMPKLSDYTVNIPDEVNSFRLYDDGGKSTPYSSGLRSSILFTTSDNNLIQATGSITSEQSRDFLSFYGSDGALIGNEKYGNGGGEDIGRIVSSDNELKVYFESDGSSNYSGFDLEISTGHPITVDPDYADGTVETIPSCAIEGAQVRVTAVPDTGYSLTRLTIDGQDQVLVPGQTEYTFVMPAHNVDISAEFTANGPVVTFDSDGGTAVQKKVAENGTITEPETPTKENCRFIGWYDGDTKFDFNTQITQDMTLKAKWGIDWTKVTASFTDGTNGMYKYTGDPVEPQISLKLNDEDLTGYIAANDITGTAPGRYTFTFADSLDPESTFEVEYYIYEMSVSAEKSEGKENFVRFTANRNEDTEIKSFGMVFDRSRRIGDALSLDNCTNSVSAASTATSEYNITVVDAGAGIEAKAYLTVELNGIEVTAYSDSKVFNCYTAEQIANPVINDVDPQIVGDKLSVKTLKPAYNTAEKTCTEMGVLFSKDGSITSLEQAENNNVLVYENVGTLEYVKRAYVDAAKAGEVLDDYASYSAKIRFDGENPIYTRSYTVLEDDNGMKEYVYGSYCVTSKTN